MKQKKGGSGEAIAKSMFTMANLRVPIISVIIGEGSSGIANKVLMLENAVYSILSPEGYSAILWKDSSRCKEAAEKMKMTADDLYKLKVIDKIIREPKEVNDISFKKLAQDMKKEIKNYTLELNKLTKEDLYEERYLKFRNMGEYIKL